MDKLDAWVSGGVIGNSYRSKAYAPLMENFNKTIEKGVAFLKKMMVYSKLPDK